MRLLYLSKGYTVHDERFLRKFVQVYETFFLTLHRRQSPCEIKGVTDLGDLHTCDSHPAALASALPALRAILKDVQPNVLHAGPIQDCGVLAVRSGMNDVAVMSWGSDMLVDAFRDAEMRSLTREALENCRFFVCDCAAVLSAAESLVSGISRRAVVFPWGIDLAVFAPKGRDEKFRENMKWSPEDQVVISLRAWKPGYGIETLLDAFWLARKTDGRLRLLMLGEGVLQRDLERRVNELGLQDSVSLMRAVPESELPYFLANSDFYMSCVPSDGASISLLQAMAMGAIPIVVDAFGNREWVSDDCGFLAPAWSVSGFAEALITASRLEDHRREVFRSCALDSVRQRADWDLNFLKIVDEYTILKGVHE